VAPTPAVPHCGRSRSRMPAESRMREGRCDGSLGSSFNHLICAKQNRVRDRDPERSRGTSVDSEILLRRLLHWKVSGLCASEDSRGHAIHPRMLVPEEMRMASGVPRLCEFKYRFALTPHRVRFSVGPEYLRGFRPSPGERGTQPVTVVVLRYLSTRTSSRYLLQ